MSAETFARIDRKKRNLLAALLVFVLLAVTMFAGYFIRQSAVVAGERASLSATGTIEAKQVTASFKLPGKLASLLVEEGAPVEAGQALATLENQQLLAKLVQAEGAHEAARAQAAQAGSATTLTAEQVEATINQLEAKVAQAEVGLNDAEQLYARVSALYEADAAAASEYDKAENNLNLNQRQLEEARAGLEQALAARTQIQVAEAQHQAALGQTTQARGALQEVQSTIDDAVLKAPTAGYITQKYLEAGEMLNAGTPVFQITDLEHPYVKVFFSEEKIGRVRLGQEAEVTVPAFPDQVFKGRVVWINEAGEFAVRKAVNEQYQRDLHSFEVKIEIPNAERLLKVGMTATVKLVEEAD